MALLVLVCLAVPALRHFDRDVPDAEPDDLVGLATLAARTGSATPPATPPAPAVSPELPSASDSPSASASRTGTEAAAR